MEFVVNSNLLEEFLRVSGVAKATGSIEILSHVLLTAKGDEVTLAATDLEVVVTGSCLATVKAPGAAAVPAKKFLEVLRALPFDGEVTVRLESNQWVTLTEGESEFTMPTLQADTFPAIPTAQGEKVLIEGKVLSDLISRVSFTAAKGGRFYLDGALMVLEPGSLSMVGTDGHRLAYASVKGEYAAARRVLIPSHALAELVKLVSEDMVLFRAGDYYNSFESAGWALLSKVVEGSFPAFEKVIEKTGTAEVQVPTERLSAAVKRAKVASDKGGSVRITVASGRLAVESRSEIGSAKDSFAVEYKGAEVAVVLSSAYVKDFLGAVRSDRTGLWFTPGDSDAPVLMKPGGEVAAAMDYRYIVMPRR